MLDQKDLDILRKMVETIVENSEETILKRVDEKICKSEKLILDEIERTRNILDNRIDKMKKSSDELNQFYKITKLENDNTALLLKMVDELSGRMEKLEKSTA